jgi:hypothetical protein
MNTNVLKRFILGLFSSLLLAAGFAHAADRLDPISLSLRGSVIQKDGEGAPPCSMPCMDGDDGDR